MTDWPAHENHIARNIAIWRTARRLTQKSLANRMGALGFGWRQQIVASVERGQRRVTTAEAIGLALALETTVAVLLTPAEPFSSPTGEVVLPSGDILAATDIESLLYSGNTHAVTWDGDKPVFHPGGLVIRNDSQTARSAETIRAEGNPMPEPSTTPEPQPVVAAIVTSDLGVLVGKRNDGKPPWTFIAGEIEPGESPADAAVREVKEETGCEIEAGEVIGRRVHPKTGRTMIYMAGMPVRGTKVFVGDSDELAEVRWVGLAELDELMGAGNIFEPVRAHLERAIRPAGNE